MAKKINAVNVKTGSWKEAMVISTMETDVKLAFLMQKNQPFAKNGTNNGDTEDFTHDQKWKIRLNVAKTNR